MILGGPDENENGNFQRIPMDTRMDDIIRMANEDDIRGLAEAFTWGGEHWVEVIPCDAAGACQAIRRVMNRVLPEPLSPG